MAQATTPTKPAANGVPEKPDLLASVREIKNEQKAVREAIEKMRRPVYPNGSRPGVLFAEPSTNPEKRGGFKSFSHFCHDVMRHGAKGEKSETLLGWEKQLITKAPAGMDETVGSEGGFLVPPEFSNELLRRTYDNDLLSRTRAYTCAGNELSIPAIDETSRVDGSRFGGIRAYWDIEAAQFTSSKPAYDRVILKLKKLIAICYATDELVQDTGTALETHLMDLFAQEIAFKCGDGIVNGTGAGMPQGMLNAPALVTVSKEVGQAAATILFENINKMWQHLYAPSRANAVWLVNQDVENQLATMSLGIGTAGMPVYLPPGGVSEKPYATLKGRPVIPVEFCSTLGTAGDIILTDLSQYLTLRKGDTEQESSIHFKFDTAEVAFRVLFRMDGRCWWTSGLTPYHGSNTLTPMVALATRS